MSSMQRLREAIAPHGLVVRAAFTPRAQDAVPPVAPGLPTRLLALIGNVGSSLWPAFRASPEFADGADHPLDRWSRRIGEDTAARCAGRALFPFAGPPYHPFQRWALRGGNMFASPVGMLIDPRCGLWHAFRFAIALPDRAEQAAPSAASPCSTCEYKPCLSACPVSAFTPDGYRYADCADHLAANGDATCWKIGCLARHACPLGQGYRYVPEQAGLHLRAFVAKRRSG